MLKRSTNRTATCLPLCVRFIVSHKRTSVSSKVKTRYQRHDRDNQVCGIRQLGKNALSWCQVSERLAVKTILIFWFLHLL